MQISSSLSGQSEVRRGWLSLKTAFDSKISSKKFSPLLFSAILSLVFACFFNLTFFERAWQTLPIKGVGEIIFLMSLAAVLWLLTLFLVSLITLPYVVKPVGIFLLISGSFAAYFMDIYGISIDREMLRNVLQTDFQESRDLLSPRLILYVILLGVIPSLLIAKLQISWSGFIRESIIRIATMVISLVIAALLIVSFSTYYSTFFRLHKDVRFFANPLGYLYATGALVVESFQEPLVMETISADARLGAGTLAQSKPVLLVFIVGETARIDNFGLAGYSRNTTPLLQKQDILFFDHMTSCGTSTAVSVPCLFSNLTRKGYSEAKAISRHNLLDFISTAGVDVLWRDNNSGCKGTCTRVNYESFNPEELPQWCSEGNCFDEVLLENIDNKLLQKNQFIVLHQKGSHGPSYDKRYPDSMRLFTPVCKSNQLQQCSREEVVNAYDNSILYTDYFLNKVVGWLRSKQDSYNTAMIYVSDHGESLGENNLFLHGMPYAVAPQSQKSVPFIFWASSGFYRDRKLSRECLQASTSTSYSHDNLFHSFLGLLDIRSAYYKPELDIFHSCTERFN